MAKRFASHKRTLESLSSVTKGNSFQVGLRIGEISPTDADGLPISKFRYYVNFRRLRAPHHIGAADLTSTNPDEAGIFAHLLLQAGIVLAAHSEHYLFIPIKNPPRRGQSAGLS